MIGNSLKFSHEGEVEVRVYPKDVQSQIIVFEIQDQGIGMNEQQQQKLKDILQSKIGEKVCRTSTGIGLGLLMA